MNARVRCRDTTADVNHASKTVRIASAIIPGQGLVDSIGLVRTLALPAIVRRRRSISVGVTLCPSKSARSYACRTRDTCFGCTANDRLLEASASLE